MEDTPIVPPHIADGPAERMSMADFERHLSGTLIIEVAEPQIRLSQGSWLRCSRANLGSTLRGLLTLDVNHIKLTVKDSRSAASCRQLTDEQRQLFAERDATANQMGGE